MYITLINYQVLINPEENALTNLKTNPNNTNETLEFKLISKTQISPDSFIFTFELPENLKLGLFLGEHVAIE